MGYIVHSYILDADIENDADVKRHERELNKINLYNKLKNDGFYVGLLEDTFFKPSEIIDLKLAKESLEKAQKLYAFFEPIEKEVKGQIEEIVKKNERFVRMINDEKSDIYKDFHKILEEERSRKNSGEILLNKKMD